MEKTFDPAAVEARISLVWEAAEAFKAGRPERAGAKPFTIVIPPPNVTGNLHMGHALNNTLQDILCRFERMRGRDVLWQPGLDHAGIATQMVVERQLAERGEPGRRDMGRDAFLQRVWQWREESGGAIVHQLKRLGASCDWPRERFTMGRREDGEAGQMQRATLQTFVTLFRDGLIYRDKRLVNWDPKFQSAISDLEVELIERKSHMYYFDYPLDENPDIKLTIATTRPETMLGDGAVAVHPDDPRYSALVGKMVRLPLANRLIPVIADAYADPEKGSGAVKITPAHDFNDFEVGRRHNLPLINLMTPEAVMNDNCPVAYRGLDRFEARKRIIADIDALGLLNRVEPLTHAVPHGDRSGVVIEPYLTDQWYVDAKTLAQPALKAVRDGDTVFTPKNWEKTYFEWLNNIQPWCVSRQLWWGHRIPAWYGVKVTRTEKGGSFEMPKAGTQGPLDTENYEVFVAGTEAEAVSAAQAYYGPGVSVQVKEREDRPQLFGIDGTGSLFVTLMRDPDVLDTWFSSALWPFSTLGWPDETPELARFYPTSTLVTGFDIIFFWVARMMMMGLHLRGAAPFKDVYIHALVRDEKGAKMSKSKGNVMDPLVLIDSFGADALRFTLAAMAAQGRDIKLSASRVEGYRNFATKLWNSARFAEMNGCLVHDQAFKPREAREALNLWAFGELARTRGEITEALENYRFNDAANAAYRFVWGVFCDWYVELAKPVLQGEDGAEKSETRGAMAFLLYEIVKLLHPFMPFLTEELWTSVTAGQRGVLALAHWPKLEGLENPEAEAEIGWLVELVSEIRSVRSEMNVPGAAQIPLLLVNAAPEVQARAQRWSATLQRLARLSEVGFAAAPPKGSAQLLVRGDLVALPLQGVIDLAAEEARLEKEIGRLRADVGKTQAKLANADFVSRAPEEIIEENRERVSDWTHRIAQLTAALGRLRA